MLRNQCVYKFIIFVTYLNCYILVFHLYLNPLNDLDDDLYSLVHKPVTPTHNQVLGDQLAQYLSSSNTTTDCRSSYAAVKHAFIKANSTLPRSAAVERLFSAAGQILCNGRCKLSDDMCDTMLRQAQKNCYRCCLVWQSVELTTAQYVGTWTY